MYKMIGFLLMALVLTACGSMDQSLSPYKDGNASPQKVTFKEGENTDVADLNPNFLDLNTENEAHNNIGYYRDKLRSIVDESEHFDSGMIYTNGAKAVVNVTPKENYAKDELSKHKKDLQQKLQKAVPRYNVDLRVNTNGK